MTSIHLFNRFIGVLHRTQNISLIRRIPAVYWGWGQCPGVTYYYPLVVAELPKNHWRRNHHGDMDSPFVKREGRQDCMARFIRGLH